jgi:fibronectin type 3 domain-containing protein
MRIWIIALIGALLVTLMVVYTCKNDETNPDPTTTDTTESTGSTTNTDSTTSTTGSTTTGDSTTSTSSSTGETLIDVDDDGYYANDPNTADIDCDDLDPNINPGVTEVINNGKNDDCDASTEDVCPATAPGTVSASDAAYSDKITVTWDAVTDATGYSVLRSEDDSTYTELSTTATTSYDDTTATAGTTFYYKIVAIKTGCPDTAPSASDTGTVLSCPAAAPTGLTASSSYADRVELSWDSVAEATSYQVQRSDDDVTFAEITTTASTTYDDTTATPGTTYYYQLVATKTGCADAGPTTSVTGMRLACPPIPTSVAAVLNGNEIDISWDTSAAAEGYEIYVSTDGSSYTSLDSIGDGSTGTYTDTAPTSCSDNYYKVSATHGTCGETAQSDPSSAVDYSPAPLDNLSPSDVTDASGCGFGICLRGFGLGVDPGFGGFIIQVSTDGGGNYNPVSGSPFNYDGVCNGSYTGFGYPFCAYMDSDTACTGEKRFKITHTSCGTDGAESSEIITNCP